jgi:methionyl aminopeptidase
MSGITRKSTAEIALMRRAGSVVAEVLALVEELAVPGASSAEIAAAAERKILALGATSNFKGYHGFTARWCTGSLATERSRLAHSSPWTQGRSLRAGTAMRRAASTWAARLPQRWRA